MLTKNIKFKNFLIKNKKKNISKKLKSLLSENNEILKTLSVRYKYSYTKKIVSKFKKYQNITLIGMGGSILGSQAIYDFIKHKIKKKVFFVNNLDSRFFKKKKVNKNLNLIISKSGNTLETITNSNILIKKNDKNIFITEKTNNYLSNLGKKLRAEIIEHKNYIGGRYSVLSEVGMLPAELMGLNEKKFKQFDNLIKNKFFLNNLIANVESTLHFLKNGKFTSVILNYDEQSESIFKWYQQLVAESLGKKSKGILPVISSMPKDNHSLMQFYLDGPKKSFYTFFYVHGNNLTKINSNQLLATANYLKNKDVQKIIYSQKLATENVFKKKKIPFRSFEIVNRDEKSLGELFSFFIMETILLGRALNVNPFDQPSVELIKKETKKILT
jgi:glucose-6-phosphate isomerase